MKKINFIKSIVIAVVLAITTTANAQWTVVGSKNFTSGAAFNQCLGLDTSGTPYLAFSDYTQSSKATVVKFDSASASWVTVGAPGFTSTMTDENSSFTFNSQGVPYYAYMDFTSGYKANVMKFDGTNWVYVGSQGFSVDKIQYPSIAISPTGVPFVAYKEYNISTLSPTVMKFDGTNWVATGTSANAGGGTSNYLSLKFNPIDGVPYVAFAEGNGRLIKFDGTNWVDVTANKFSNDPKYLSLAFSNDGIPYIAFTERDTIMYSQYVSVVKFNGVGWENVGPAMFSDGEFASHVTLAFSPVTNIPYVAYRQLVPDLSVVKKFDGTNWVTISDTTFITDFDTRPSMAISKKGEIYLSYSDKSGNYKATVMKYVEPTTTGIYEEQLNTLSIYPNPANSTITIENLPNSAAVTIIDVTGKQVYSTVAGSPTLTLNTGEFANGVYLLQVINNGTVATKRLVVTK